MKYLSDTEILNWNKRLERSDYSVYPLSNARSGNPDIIFRQKINNGYGMNAMSNQLVETLDPFIRYDFTFSIASNRKETFLDLFEKLSKEAFGTKSIYRDQKGDNTTLAEQTGFTPSFVSYVKRGQRKVNETLATAMYNLSKKRVKNSVINA